LKPGCQIVGLVNHKKQQPVFSPVCSYMYVLDIEIEPRWWMVTSIIVYRLIWMDLVL